MACRNSLVIGLDLGTSRCKAAAYTLDGHEMGAAQMSVPTARPRQGWVEQDPADWRRIAIAVLRDVAEQLGDDRAGVRAIGVSAHGPSAVFASADLRPLAASPTWQDLRSTSLGRRLLAETRPDWVGLGMPETALPAKIAWFQRHQPSVVESARYICGAKAYLIGCLTGKVIDEPSSGPSEDDQTRAIFGHLGIAPGLLPPCQPSLSSAGPLDSAVARATTLSRDVEVVLGLNDGASATLGAGVIGVGEGIVTMATNGVVRRIVPERLAGDQQVAGSFFCYPFVDGLWIVGGITKGAGDTLRWLLDIIYGSAQETEDLFSVAEAEASRSPAGSNGAVFLPYLLGRGTPASTDVASAGFFNLARSHVRGDVIRAVMEGVCFALRDIVETLEGFDTEIRGLRLTGGAADNPLWRQILADVLDQPLTRCDADSVLGAAIAAAVGQGLHGTVQEAVEAMVKEGPTVEPDPVTTADYAQIRRRFQGFQTLIAEAYDEASPKEEMKPAPPEMF